MAIHTFIYTGTIPAENGGDASPAYHAFPCPTGYRLISAAGSLQNGNDQAVPFSPLGYTPSEGLDAVPFIPAVATEAIFSWGNPKVVEQSYQVTLICEETS